MSAPWNTDGTRSYSDLDNLQIDYANARAAAIRAERDPQIDQWCVSLTEDLRLAARSLLTNIFTGDNIFFADVRTPAYWVGGPSETLMETISGLADPSCARDFPELPCFSCLAALFRTPRIPSHALDQCRRTNHSSHHCARCERKGYTLCRRLTSSVSTSIMATLTTAFRSGLGRNYLLPAVFQTQRHTSDDARRLLIFVMYLEHRRVAWAEYCRYSFGAYTVLVPSPGSDVHALLLEQESQNRRVEIEMANDVTDDEDYV